MITLSSNIQSERRDCIVVCSDLQIAIRANGEEVTQMVDVAGNLYPAGIPEATVAPTPALGTVNADALADGWYAWTYVYAAKNRYPYIDAGKAMQGSIAPRGNPAPYNAVFHVTGGPREVDLSMPGCSRLDVDQIIIYRTIMWGTQAEAKLAAAAGQMFSIALIDNALPTASYTDDAFEPTGNEQVEYDNNFAPTMQFLAYESPFLWGIGNDPLIKRVTWASNTILLDDTGKWFEGRNGQLVTVTGITTGGIDGRGTFIFKAGNAAGLNINTAAILTLDGVLPETLFPSTGSGYIKIQGPPTTLYRSKPRNPLAWGETIFVGTARFSQLFARKISGSRATAIAIVPGGEFLKIDVKDPSKSYTFSLRSAGTPNFETSRREISDMSVSHHFSQFAALGSNKQKVLWGWDYDNHAILECDGNTQRIISDSVFQTLRACQTETVRAQYAHGLCNEALELNILFLPYGDDINATDLALFQHYPSGTWGTALVGDLLCSCSVRDPLTNLLRYICGRDFGWLGEHQKAGAYEQRLFGAYDILSYTGDDTVSIAGASYTPAHTGNWFMWYSNEDKSFRYGRVSAITLNSITGDTDVMFDKIISIGGGHEDTYTIAVIGGNVVTLAGTIATAKMLAGPIPVVMEKFIELGTPTMLKTLEAVTLSGDVDGFVGDPGNLRMYLIAPDESTVDRYPKGTDYYFDDVIANQGNYVFQSIATPQHGKFFLRFVIIGNTYFSLRMLNLDVR